MFLGTTSYKGTVYNSFSGYYHSGDHESDYGLTIVAIPISGKSQKFLLDLTSDSEKRALVQGSVTQCRIRPSLEMIDYPMANFFSITTSVTNGTITPSVYEVKERSSETISYLPNPGYVLESVVVDGENVSISDFRKNYIFSNINSNHDIVVKYVRAVTNLYVSKFWDDDNNRDEIRPDSIQFNLFCGAAECGDNPYTITEDNNWSITVPDIPIYDNNGQEYTYSVVELGMD